MFLLLWTGWGFLVPVLVGVAFVLTQWFGNILFGPYFYETHDWTKLFATLLASVSIWFVGKYFNNKPGRELIDKKTGKEIVLKPHNTLFFIKMEYWAFIILILGIIISFA